MEIIEHIVEYKILCETISYTLIMFLLENMNALNGNIGEVFYYFVWRTAIELNRKYNIIIICKKNKEIFRWTLKYTYKKFMKITSNIFNVITVIFHSNYSK